MAVLEVRHLACVRGNKHLFKNVSFNLQETECLLVIGPNGSGKSSLLKILSGLCAADKGSIHWRSFLPELSMSYLSHKDALRKALTPFENIMSHLKIHATFPTNQINQVTMKNKIFSLLHQLDLLECAHLPCAQLSAGQNRKVSLALIVLSQKKVWLLDEPFTSLDKKSILCLTSLMRQHLNNKGMIILSSHFFDFKIDHQVIHLGGSENV